MKAVLLLALLGIGAVTAEVYFQEKFDGEDMLIHLFTVALLVELFAF